MPQQAERVLKTTSFRIPADRHKALRFLALEKGISMGKACEQAVEAWMRENGKSDQQPCHKDDA